MKLSIVTEWDVEIGFPHERLDSFWEPIEAYFQDKSYGTSVSTVYIGLIGRGHIFKQRKIFRPRQTRLEFDVLVNFSPVRDSPKDKQTAIIKRDFIEYAELTLAKYKFPDFNKDLFLKDLSAFVMALKW